MSVRPDIKYRPAAEVLSDIMELYGMTLETLSAKIDMPPQNVAAYLTGNHKDEVRYHVLKSRIKKSFNFSNDIFYQGKNGRKLMEELAAKEGHAAVQKTETVKAEEQSTEAKTVAKPQTAAAPKKETAEDTSAIAEKYGQLIMPVLKAMEEELAANEKTLSAKVIDLEASLQTKEEKIAQLEDLLGQKDGEIEELKKSARGNNLSEKAKKAIEGISIASDSTIDLVINLLSKLNGAGV